MEVLGNKINLADIPLEDRNTTNPTSENLGVQLNFFVKAYSTWLSGIVLLYWLHFIPQAIGILFYKCPHLSPCPV